MKSFESASLMKNESEAIEAAIRMLKSEFSVSKIILFGSKARGDHGEHSDIDLLVVASKLLHLKEEKAIVEALFDIGMEYVLFSVLCSLSLMSGRKVYSRSFLFTRKSHEMEL
jgi:predicted nucleotidyltransferase